MRTCVARHAQATITHDGKHVVETLKRLELRLHALGGLRHVPVDAPIASQVSGRGSKGPPDSKGAPRVSSTWIFLASDLI